MANHEVYVVQGKTLDNIAGTMRAVLGVDKDTPIRFDEVASSDKTEQINTDIETQTDLIAQIKTALDGKAGAIGSEVIAEIVTLIDESGVLESTDGTATEKIEQLIDKAEDENIWYLNSELLTDIPTFQHTTFEKLPRMNPIKAKNFAYKFSFMSNLKRVDFYINSESSTRFDNCFARDKALEYVKGINTANVTTFYDMFTQCSSLKTIEEPLDFSKVTNVSGCFWGCNALENIRIVPESIKISITISSPVLSDESKDSIINGLAYVETAQTLTVSKNAGFTAEHKATAQSKGWTVVEQ